MQTLFHRADSSGCIRPVLERRFALALLVFAGSGFSLAPASDATANFAATAVLSVAANPAEGGKVAGGGTFVVGTTQTLTATPVAGYAFAGWTESMPVIATGQILPPEIVIRANPLAWTVTRNVTLTAHFSVRAEGPEIDVQGRGVSIASGDTTPAVADDTEFGAAVVPGPGVPDSMVLAGGTAAGNDGVVVNGTGDVNRARVRHTFTIRNAGSAELKLSGTPVVARSGANAADFTITQPSAASLAPGRSVPFDVTFVPSAVGARTATLTIASNDGNENPYTFALRGTGAPAPVPFLPTADQTSIAASAGAGEFRATVAIQVNTGGYSADWGPVVVQENTLTMNARVYRSNGAVTQALMKLSHVYPLGRLPAGKHQLVFKVADQVVKTATLEIASLITSVTPAGAGHVRLNPEPVGTDRYLAGTIVSLSAIPLSPVHLPGPLTPAGTANTDPALAPSILPVPVPSRVFQHWSGDVSGNSNPVSVTLGASKRVVAHFAAATGLPTVTTGPVTQITATSARVEGVVVTTGGSPVTGRGFVLSSLVASTADSNASAATTKFAEGEGEGQFSRTLTGLHAGTTYSVRAYATNSAGTSYGQPQTFRTQTPDVDTAPAIVTAPVSRAARLGSATAFTVAASGGNALSYQWKKDGVLLANDGRIGGATGRMLTLANLRFTDAGAYEVVVGNAAGSATSTPAAMLAVVDAQQIIADPDPVDPSAVTIRNTLTYAGVPMALGWQVVLPEGSSYVASAGAEGEIKPAAGATGLAEWAWTSVPASPIRFSYTLKIPPGATRDRVLRAVNVFRQADAVTHLPVLPDPLALPHGQRHHSADTNGDFRISLVELTRAMALYNTRNGTLRTGQYGVAVTATEDGFAPEPVRAGSAAAELPRYYSADSNRDGKLSLNELTRMFELYNVRNGTIRTGAYRVQTGTEDGFAPGP